MDCVKNFILAWCRHLDGPVEPSGALPERCDSPRQAGPFSQEQLDGCLTPTGGLWFGRYMHAVPAELDATIVIDLEVVGLDINNITKGSVGRATEHLETRFFQLQGGFLIRQDLGYWRA